MSIVELNRGTGSYVRSTIASFLRVDELDVGLFEVPSTLFAYVRTDKTWRPSVGEWDGFTRAMFEAPARRAYLFFLPADVAPEFGQEVARRVYVAATGLGFTTDAERAAFALGGAQAVADLVLGEQRERQPAQRVLTA